MSKDRNTSSASTTDQFSAAAIAFSKAAEDHNKGAGFGKAYGGGVSVA